MADITFDDVNQRVYVASMVGGRDSVCVPRAAKPKSDWLILESWTCLRVPFEQSAHHLGRVSPLKRGMHAYPYLFTQSGPYMASYSDLSRWTSLRTQNGSGFPNTQGFGYSVPLQKILVDPATANHLLAFQGSKRGWSNGNFVPHVWESNDAGLSWKNVSLVAPVTGDETANVMAVDWVS